MCSWEVDAGYDIQHPEGFYFVVPSVCTRAGKAVDNPSVAGCVSTTPFDLSIVIFNVHYSLR